MRLWNSEDPCLDCGSHRGLEPSGYWLQNCFPGKAVQAPWARLAPGFELSGRSGGWQSSLWWGVK